MIRSIARSAGALTALCLFTVSAFSHATFDDGMAQIGGEYHASIHISHGCDGEATQLVRVQIPAGFFDVTAMPKEGWELKTLEGAYENMYMHDGEHFMSGVKEIVWSGGHLADKEHTDFMFHGRFDEDFKPGDTLYFPTIQECAHGMNEWTGREDAEFPAPKVTLMAGAEMAGMTHDHGHEGDHMDMDHDMIKTAETVILGDLELSGAFTRAMPPRAVSGGGFITITNNGLVADRLVSACSPVSEVVEPHVMTMENNVMKMHSAPNGFVIEPGETLTLKPGGNHLMFINVTDPFVEGKDVMVTLNFEHAGSVDLMLPVAKIGAGAGMDHGDMEHGDMDHSTMTMQTNPN